MQHYIKLKWLCKKQNNASQWWRPYDRFPWWFMSFGLDNMEVLSTMVDNKLISHDQAWYFDFLIHLLLLQLLPSLAETDLADSSALGRLRTESEERLFLVTGNLASKRLFAAASWCAEKRCQITCSKHDVGFQVKVESGRKQSNQGFLL